MAARVILFGPTGNVGSIAARTTQQLGAKVFLAMRDLYKPIPGLTAADEAESGFERVEADLMQPQSVLAAVRQTKTTTAFIYLIWASTDHMRATLQALKEAGITFIVFLSSFTIHGDLHKIKPNDHHRIPYVHAQVELNLEEIYGSKNYVALRCGAFATNTLGWKTGIKAGEVKLDNPDTEFDYITPTDMGTVAGTILAKGQRDGQHIVYLYGPRMMAQKDAMKIALTAVGKNMKAVSTTAREDPQQQDVSDVGSQDVLIRLGTGETSEWLRAAYSNFEAEVGNVQKYTGQLPMEYKDWVESNKERFTSE